MSQIVSQSSTSNQANNISDANVTTGSVTRSPPVAGSALNFARGANNGSGQPGGAGAPNVPVSSPTPPSHSRSQGNGGDAPRPNRPSVSSSNKPATPSSEAKKRSSTSKSSSKPHRSKSSSNSNRNKKRRSNEFEGLANVCTDDNLSSSLDDYDPNRVNDKARYVEAKSGSKFRVTDCRRTPSLTTTTTGGGGGGGGGGGDTLLDQSVSSSSFRGDINLELQQAQREEDKRELAKKEAKTREDANTIGCQEALRRMEVLMGEAVEYHRRKGSYVLQQKLLDQMRSKYGPGMNPRLHATRTAQNYLAGQKRRDEAVERWKHQQQQLLILQTQSQQSIVNFIPGDALPNGGASSQNNASNSSSHFTSSATGSGHQQQHLPVAPGAIHAGKTVPPSSSLTNPASSVHSAPGLSSECGDRDNFCDQSDEVSSSIDSREIVTPLSSLREDLRQQASSFGREDIGVVPPSRVSPSTSVTGVTSPSNNNNNSTNNNRLLPVEGEMNRAALSGSSAASVANQQQELSWNVPTSEGSVSSNSAGGSHRPSATQIISTGLMPPSGQRPLPPPRPLQQSTSDNSLELSSGSASMRNPPSSSTILLNSPHIPASSSATTTAVPHWVLHYQSLPRISPDPNQILPKNLLFDALAEVLLLDLRVIFLRNPVQGFQLSRKFFGEIRLWEL